MRRRPLCMVCLILTITLTILHRLGVPLLPEPPGNRRADLIADQEKHSCVTVMGQVRSGEIRDEYTDCILTDVYLIQEREKYRIGDVRLYLENPIIYPVGCTLMATGQLTGMPEASNPGQFDSALFYRIQKIRYRMKKADVQVADPRYNRFRESLAALQRRLKTRITAVFPKQEAGILAAMLIGDKSMIGDESRARWQMAGVVHMLAISGLHLTILGMGLYGILKRFRIRDTAAIPLAVTVMFLYSVFTGLAVSTLRAFLMFSVLMGARLFGRTYDPLTALSFAAILILLDNPYYLFYSGFQLSFSAVFFCILFGKRTKSVMSLMLTLGMLPLILLSFFEMPLYSIPINLIAVPLLPVILGTGIAGTLLGGIMAVPAVFLLRTLDLLFRFTEKLPYASFITGKPSAVCALLYYFLFAVWAYYMKKYRAYKRKLLLLACVPVLIFLLIIHPEKQMRMTFLDVGQGDSCIIETPHRRNILVDGGSSTVQNVGTYRILPAIRAEGIRKLDYLIVTHMDSDHTSGIGEVLDAVKKRKTTLRVDTVVFPYLKERGEAYRELLTKAREAGARVLFVSDGDRIAADGCEMRFLNPDPAKEEIPVDENGQCIVFHLRYRSFDALMTGDVQGEGEQNILNEWKKEQRKYSEEVTGKRADKNNAAAEDGNARLEILKVAHHGSAHSTPKEFLNTVRPAFGIISVGRANRYGHPTPELLKRLQEAGTRILRTDASGAITVDTDGKKYRISTFF